MKRRLRYNLVDVFTNTALTGNPLAVFTNGRGLSQAEMQRIAREMNLSETVFFLPPEQGGHARVRIFTPLSELPFAGHPVLGSAWILGQPMEMSPLVLETQAGLIVVQLERQGGVLQSGQMKQPFPELREFSSAERLLEALGVSSSKELLAPVLAHNGPKHVLVEVSDRERLDSLDVDFSRLERAFDEGGVLVYYQEGHSCYARYFAPAAGIREDPATGSANGPLGVLLHQRGRLETGVTLTVFQGQAMGRPSELFVTIRTSMENEIEVWVGGSAIVIGRGELEL